MIKTLEAKGKKKSKIKHSFNKHNKLSNQEQANIANNTLFQEEQVENN